VYNNCIFIDLYYKKYSRYESRTLNPTQFQTKQKIQRMIEESDYDARKGDRDFSMTFVWQVQQRNVREQAVEVIAKRQFRPVGISGEREANLPFRND